jgi:putative hydrolase of the HAD superfamily
MMIGWDRVETVLLDMDGTLLDLHYDNHFWRSHVPMRYAEKHGIAPGDAHAELMGRYARMAGTLEWYSVTFWAGELGLDIARLKEEVAHLIAVHPGVEDFLVATRASGRRVLLVTNAHERSLSLKMDRTGLARYFDAMVVSHDLGLPKEHPDFWKALVRVQPFDPGRAALVDDSLAVLRAARDFGIAQCFAVRRPDTKAPEVTHGEFPFIENFADVLPPD